MTAPRPGARRWELTGGPVLRYPFNALVSFHYYRKHDLTVLTRAGLRLIGDSGAFSAASTGAPISVAEFAEWATRWRDHLCWIAALDVIGDADGTWRNYRALREKHGVDVVPTLHAGDDKQLLDRYAADGVDFVGLGGLVPHRGRPQATLPWLVDVMRYARDKHPAMRFHGWGVTNPKLIKALPWYSVDSSNLGSPYRYARLSLFDPGTGQWTQCQLDGKDVYRIDVMLRRHYGVRAAEVAYSVPENRRTLVRLMARSYQLVEDYLRRRHGAISAPTYGLREIMPTGLNMHGSLDGPYRIERDAELLGDPERLDPAMRAGRASGSYIPDPAGPSVHAADQMQYLSLVPPVGDDDDGPRVHGVVDPKSPPHTTADALGRDGIHVHGTDTFMPLLAGAIDGAPGTHVHAADTAWEHMRHLGDDDSDGTGPPSGD